MPCFKKDYLFTKDFMKSKMMTIFWNWVVAQFYLTRAFYSAHGLIHHYCDSKWLCLIDKYDQLHIQLISVCIRWLSKKCHYPSDIYDDFLVQAEVKLSKSTIFEFHNKFSEWLPSWLNSVGQAHTKYFCYKLG